MYELRPYQSRAVLAAKKAFESGRRSALITLPTGCGKTIVFSAFIKDAVENGKRVLVLAHRNELLKQAHDKLLASAGIDAVCETTALGKISGTNTLAVISSVQTVSSRISKGAEMDYDYIIVDEAHHLASPTYQTVLSACPGAKVLGVTATPVRGDGVDISESFDAVVSKYTTAEAIKDGYLSPIKIDTCQSVSFNLTGAHLQRGDFAAGDVDAAVSPFLKRVAEVIAKKAAERKTMVFLPLISTAQKMAEVCKEEGLRADWVSGERKDSESVLEAFRNGNLDVLCNSVLLTEGYDEPSVDCIVNLRATKSPGLYTQILGRGLRLSPQTGKKDCLVLDFLWQDNGRGQLTPPEALFADESPEVKEALRELSYKGGDPLEMLEPAKSAASARLADALKNRQETTAVLFAKYTAAKNLRESAVAMIRSTLKNPSVPHSSRVMHMNGADVVEISYEGVYDNDVVASVSKKATKPAVLRALRSLSLEHVPLTAVYSLYGNRSWFLEPPTESQRALIKRFGIPAEVIVSKGHAMVFIDTMILRSKLSLASFGQLKVLSAIEGVDVGFLTKSEAKKVIDMISKKKCWAHPDDSITEYAQNCVKKREEAFYGKT